MNKKQLIGIGIFVVLIVAVVGIKLFMDSDDKVDLSKLKTVYVATGGGKEDFIADEKVIEILQKKYGLNVVFDSWSNGKTITAPLIREYIGEDAVRKVVQIEMINNLLNGVSLEDINVDVNKDVVMCVSGGDWYISKDSNGNLKQFVLDNCKDKDRALVEMSSYIVVPDNIDIKGTRGVSK